MICSTMHTYDNHILQYFFVVDKDSNVKDEQFLNEIKMLSFS